MNERKFFLVRHLATDYNREGKIMGAVVDAGVKKDDDQVEKFKRALRQLGDDFQLAGGGKIALFSSPLTRCLETTAIIGETLGIDTEPVLDDRLKETNMGDFSGKKALDLRKEYGDEAIDTWMYRPSEFTFPGGESYENVRKRAKEFVEYLRESTKGQEFIFVCSHVDIIKMIICEISSIPFNSRRLFSIPNGSISVIAISGDNPPAIESLNSYP